MDMDLKFLLACHWWISALKNEFFISEQQKKSQVQFQPERFESKHMNILSSLKITNVLALTYFIWFDIVIG